MRQKNCLKIVDPCQYAFKDYNTIRTHSSISFLPPDEFGRRWNESDEFRN